MNYTEFRNKVNNYPYFRSNILSHLTDKPAILRRQISEWLGKDLLVTLKRGLYTLNEADRNVGLSHFGISQVLYTPSYISLESALSYYNLIPEKVVTITALSTKKTQQFVNHYGKFTYQHLSPHCFNGFISSKDEYGNSYFIASKEKALIDFFYFRINKLPQIEKNIFEKSYRLQNLDSIDRNKLLDYAKLFQQKKLIHLVELFLEYLEENYAGSN